MRSSPVQPRRLVAGDLVRLLSPASYPTAEQVAAATGVLESWGLRVDVGEHALDRFGYMAGTDDERLADLNEAFRDPEVRAIVTTRGGAGAYRIADRIDFAAVRADPKPLVGFSDITSLHLSLQHGCDVGSIHGCVVGDTAQVTVRQLLMTTEPLVVQSDRAAVSAEVRVGGTATGMLVGGNLAMVATSIGAWMPTLAGAILFLEDQQVVGLGTIDRQLTQLRTSGALDGIVGVVLGSFEGFRGYEDRGWTIHDVLADRLGTLGVPVLGGITAGHDLTGADGGPDQTALPLGTDATLSADEGTLTLAPLVA